FTIYVDGTPLLVEGESAAMLPNGQELVFGQSHAGERWNGAIDDVRIYDRAQSQAEVQLDMNTPVGTPPPVDPTPPAVQLFSPASGTSVWGVTTIRALASDPDSGIAGVQFQLDGASLGGEVTS